MTAAAVCLAAAKLVVAPCGRPTHRLRRGRPCRAGSWRFDDLSGASTGVSSNSSGVSTFDELWREQIRAMERAQSEMAEMQRQMDQSFQAAQREAGTLEHSASSRGWQEQIGGPTGPCGYSWKHSEQHEGPGGSVRAYRSESFTVIGVPQSCSGTYAAPPATTQLGPLAGVGMLTAATLAGFWAAATVAFNKRFHCTIYKEQHRWWILLLWPLLLLFSTEFRQEFWTALQGHQAGGELGETDGEPYCAERAREADVKRTL